ncbi:MAG: epoxyqueuosine reductase QueH [Desulfotomaculales bacterium]
MRLLLHICCAPCSVIPVDYLKEKGYDLDGYFFNPNIHPYLEWRKRKDALVEYARDIDLKLILDEEYRMEEFFRAVTYREDSRCRFCSSLRLRRAAALAREGGYDGFTTTLLVSPYQKHELIREAGKAAAAEYGVPFCYFDFRPGYREGVRRSKEMGMYRQQYCGCLYSEKERYFPGKRGGAGGK